MFAAEFVATACRGKTVASVLAEIGDFKKRDRRWLVDLFSIAAFLNYRPDNSFTSTANPYGDIPYWGRRCWRSGSSCKLWASVLSRGFQ